MILKNKALQIFDFLTAPSDKLYERAARFCYRNLAEVVEGKTAYDNTKAQSFHYFPEVAAALGSRILTHPQISQTLRGEPMAALRLLQSDYASLNGTLEPLVLSSGEATYYLLKHLHEKGITPAQSLETYHAALLKDPFWALRHHGDNPQDETLFARVLQLSKAQSEKSPLWAYINLYFSPDTEPADYVESISTAPMYAYLASRHFYDRGIEFRYMNLTGLTPRWAYHFITDGFLDDEEGLIDTMMASPDWLVEYLVESERYKDLAYTASIYEKTMQKIGPNHLQATYLKLWWERTQPHVKKMLQTAKPTTKQDTKSS